VDVKEGVCVREGVDGGVGLAVRVVLGDRVGV
jgi:hypothetical protein